MIFVPIMRGGRIVRSAIIDDDMAHLLRYRWYMRGKTGRYPIRQSPRPHRSAQLMHNDILPKRPPLYIDHINRDRMDNRRCNLRYVTNAQNQQNRRMDNDATSGIRGVYWHSRDRAWMAQVMHRGRNISCGYFRSKADAEKAVMAKRRELGWIAATGSPT